MDKNISRILRIFNAAWLLFSCLHAEAQVCFSVDKKQGCAPLTVTFSDKTPGNIKSWNWDFGDGATPSVKQNPTHTYTSVGYYDVKLTVTFADGSVKDTTYIRYIHTATHPTIYYSAHPDSVCPGSDVKFTSYIQSNEGIGSVFWDFKDGYTDTNRHPVHRYMSSGRYHPTLRVTDTLGCLSVDSLSKTIFVRKKPKTDFYTPDSVLCIKTASDTRFVTFVNKTQGAATYHWDFDDGSTSTQFQPSHTFSYGDYDVRLVAVSDEGCADTLVKKGHVSLNLFTPSFTISDSVFCKVPADVTFTGYGANYYRWRISDGGDHVYEKMTYEYKTSIREAGVYDVVLISQNRLGCTDTLRKPHALWIFDTLPEAVIDIQDTQHCNPDAVITFRNLTPCDSTLDLGLGVTAWDFGDGTANAIGDSVTHVYGKHGRWNIRCYITTPYGCPLKTIVQEIWNQRIAPVNINLETRQGCTPLYVRTNPAVVLDTSSSLIVKMTMFWGNGDSSVWKAGDIHPVIYGDDTISLSTYPPYASYTYNDTGQFTVYAYFINEQGCTRVDSTAVSVGIPPSYYWRFDSLGERCISDYRLEVFAQDSMYWDPVKGDSLPIAGAAANYYNWSCMQISGKDTASMSVGEGSHAFLNPTQLGYNHYCLQAFHNGCPGKRLCKDSLGYACPPMAKISPLLEPHVMNNLYCEYPAIHFKDSSDLSTSRTWYFGDPYFSHLPQWECDTSQRKDTLYSFHKGPYTKDGLGFIYATLIAVNDDSTGAKGMYNRCKVCYDTSYSYIRMVETYPDLRIPSICKGDTLKVYDSTLSGGIPFSLEWNLMQGRSILKTDTMYNPMFRDSALNLHIIRLPFKYVMHTPGTYSSVINGLINFSKAYDKYAIGHDTVYIKPNTAGHNVLSCQKTDVCAYTDTIDFVVYPKSIPVFSSPPHACIGDSVLFVNASYTPKPYDTAALSYRWNTAGRSDTNRNATYVFSKGGYYNVALQLTNSMGCDSGFVMKNAIYIQGINVSWTPRKNQFDVCNKSKTRLCANIVSGDIDNNLSYQWTVNNGKYLYRTPARISGKDTVEVGFDVDSSRYVSITLFVYDSVTGCTNTYTDSLFIHRPIADFISTPHVSPCPELPVDFTDTSRATSDFSNCQLVRWEWTFFDRGDTLHSYIPNPTHVYSYSGTYDVRLVVSDTLHCTDTLYRPEYVRIGGTDGKFDVSVTQGCVPLNVEFDIVTWKKADTVRMIFGDGNTTVISALPYKTDGNGYYYYKVSHSYTTPGKYIPSMETVLWSEDSDSTLFPCRQGYIGEDTIYAVLLLPKFESDTSVCLGAPVTFRNFSDEANGNILPPFIEPLDSFFWDYGNGQTDVSNFHGQTRYDSAGIFTITFRASVRGCSTEYQQQIRVIGPPDVRILHFDSTGCGHVTAFFDMDSLREDVTQFEWIFCDGTFSHERPASFDFQTTGCYPDSLVLTYSEAHCTHTYSDTICVTVFRLPAADFRIFNLQKKNITDDSEHGAQTGEKISFTDNTQIGDAPIRTWLWCFGDKDTLIGYEPNPTEHTYQGVSGTMSVMLHVIDTNGCEDSVLHTLLLLEYLRFPNVFSPNGDGINDVFDPTEAGGIFEDFDMIIYNRWGEIVWQRNCRSNGNGAACPNYDDENFWWNGRTSQGAEASEGVYFWVVKAKPLSGMDDILLHGSVTLLR